MVTVSPISCLHAEESDHFLLLRSLINIQDAKMFHIVTDESG